VTTPPEPNPLVPGMTHTPQQPSPNDPPNPLEQLAQAGAPDLTLTPEQAQRRAEIDAGTHPAVVELAPITSMDAPPSVPRAVALGTTQERYEPGAAIAFPEPHTGNVFKLYVEEFLELGDVVMVNPLTGMVCKYRDPQAEPEGVNGHGIVGDVDDQGSSAAQAEADVQAAAAALHQAPGAEDKGTAPGEPVAAPESAPTPPGAPAVDEPAATGSTPPDKPLTPAGHRDAIIKRVNELWPHLGADKTNVSQIAAGLFARLREFEQTAPAVMEHIATPPWPEKAAAEPTHVTLQAGQTFEQQMDSAEAQLAAAQAQQQAPTPPPVPQVAPPAAPPLNDPIAAAAAVAAPQNVPAEQLVTTCEHGMPGTDFSTNPPRSAACAECMMNSDGPPPHMTKLHASRFQQAYLETKCARDMCGREIHPGEIIGLVDNVGWCCAVCTKPERVPAA
jgi:hypothetical protein